MVKSDMFTHLQCGHVNKYLQWEFADDLQTNVRNGGRPTDYCHTCKHTVPVVDITLIGDTHKIEGL